MAIVKQKKGPAKKKTKRGRKRKVEEKRRGPKLSLPRRLSKPMDNFQDYLTLISGERKIGKTTLTAQFPNTFHMMFEPGSKALEIYQRPVNSWSEFVGYIDLLEQDTEFKFVSVDTVQPSYKQCFAHMCRKMVIEHPGDENDFGKSWAMIEDEFIKQYSRLFKLSKGIILLAHVEIKEVRSKSGAVSHRISPLMSSQANRFLTGVVDNWFYYGYEGDRRYLQIRGDEMVGAGTRLVKRFRTPTGEQVLSIPMGKSAKEAYANLQRAWNNRQPAPQGMQETRMAKATKAKARAKGRK